MNILRTLRTASAATVVGVIALACAKDIQTKNIREQAVKENRKLTEAEMKEITSPSLPFYLAAGSVPTWLLLRTLDERRERRKQLPEANTKTTET